MTDDEKIDTILEAAKNLSKYSMELLEGGKTHPDSFYPRKKYLYSQFMLNLSFLDGVISLAPQGQLRAMVPLVRSILEIYMNIAFAYSGPSQAWFYHLILKDELAKKKKLVELHGERKVSDKDYKKRVKEISKIETIVRSRHKELPVVANVTTKSRKLDRNITLRQKCEIIDYYLSLKPHYSAKVTMVKFYDRVYEHFSNTPHASPTELNSFYSYDESGNLQIDISGGKDRKYLASLIQTAYRYHYELTKLFLAKLTNPREHLPDNIKEEHRKVTAIKLRS